MKRFKAISACAAVAVMAFSSSVTVFADNELTTETSTSQVSTTTTTTTTTTTATDISPEDMDAAMEMFGSLFGEALANGDGEWTISTDETTDYYSDPYYDTEGNASLIKANDIIYENDEMQFIAVTTKDGHVFYILINYSAESDEDNVYFLNKVDAFDLYSLLYITDEESEEGVDPIEVVQQAQYEADRINGNNTVTKVTESAEEAATTTETVISEESNTTAKGSSGMMQSVVLIGAVAALGVGGFLAFKFLKKPKKSPADDMYDDSDDIEISEDDEF